MGYVYKHVRLDKNEPFYIGIGTTDDKYARAKSKSRRNKIWKGIIKRTDYIIEIIFDNESINFVKEKEVELIKLYGRIDLKTGILANMTDGGDGVIGYDVFNCDNYLTEVQVKEIKYLVKYLSALHICNHYGVTRPVIDNIKLGKTYTQVNEETICNDLLQKLIENKPLRKYIYKKVHRYNLSGDYIDSWESARDYCKQNNLSKNAHNNIYESCKSKYARPSCFGFMWSYDKHLKILSYDEIIDINFKNKKVYTAWNSRTKVKILQLDLNKVIINSFKSLKDCANITGYNSGTLCNVIKENRIYKNFYWQKGETYI